MAKPSKPKPAKKSWGDQKGNQWADTGACTFVDYPLKKKKKKKPRPAKLPELKACPFCEGKLRLMTNMVGRFLMVHDWPDTEKCPMYNSYKTKRLAILAANRRAATVYKATGEFCSPRSDVRVVMIGGGGGGGSGKGPKVERAKGAKSNAK